jgi:hypothetical protein
MWWCFYFIIKLLFFSFSSKPLSSAPCSFSECSSSSCSLEPSCSCVSLPCSSLQVVILLDLVLNLILGPLREGEGKVISFFLDLNSLYLMASLVSSLLESVMNYFILIPFIFNQALVLFKMEANHW